MKIGIVSPDNSWYQECVEAGLRIIEQAGVPRSATGTTARMNKAMLNTAASLESVGRATSRVWTDAPDWTADAPFMERRYL